MSNDVEALFRKINQAGLPYKVFEAEETPEDILQAAAPSRFATKGYSKPRLVEARAPEPPPPSEPTVAPEPLQIAEEPAPLAGFLRKYAPVREEETIAPEPVEGTPLKDLFARMAARD